MTAGPTFQETASELMKYNLVVVRGDALLKVSFTAAAVQIHEPPEEIVDAARAQPRHDRARRMQLVRACIAMPH